MKRYMCFFMNLYAWVFHAATSWASGVRFLAISWYPSKRKVGILTPIRKTEGHMEVISIFEPSPHVKTETDPVSETLCFLFI
jgi:hypothetical protein